MRRARRHSHEVLIVDDDEETLELLEELLRAAGYGVSCAHNGHEALELLRRPGAKRPRLVLLDLRMPIMDGWEFRRRQRLDRDLASIPVLMLSGDDQLSEVAASVGAVHWLMKPIDVDALLTTVKKVTGGPGRISKQGTRSSKGRMGVGRPPPSTAKDKALADELTRSANRSGGR